MASVKTLDAAVPGAGKKLAEGQPLLGASRVATMCFLKCVLCGDIPLRWTTQRFPW